MQTVILRARQEDSFRTEEKKAVALKIDHRTYDFDFSFEQPREIDDTRLKDILLRNRHNRYTPFLNYSHSDYIHILQ